MKKALKVPFDKNGHMQGYPYNPYEWKDNHEFDAELTLNDFGRGRSSVKFHLNDGNGNTYEMFVTDFVDMCQRVIIKKGKVKGTFYFVKRGQNYGIKLK